MARMQADLRQGQLWLAQQEKDQAVLQLVTETERAAGLVISTAAPKPAGDGLVDQPGVGHQVEGWVRRLHL